MSSATSIDPSTHREPQGRPALSRGTKSLGVGRSRGVEDSQAVKGAEAQSADRGLRPWQFFLLAGMLSATAVVIVATGQSPASIIILSLTVLATSLVALGAYRALAPLVLPEAAEAPALVAGRTRAALEREKTLVLRSIKELEFDFAMEKISQSDFDEMGGRLRARAIGLMRQLDEEGGYKTVIEHELVARLAANPKPAGVAPPPQCQCGVTNDADARFCKHCGTKLAKGLALDIP